MALPWECFCVDFYFGMAHGAIIFQRPLAQLFPAAWPGGTGKWSVYLS
jgi:hypothetical protein